MGKQLSAFKLKGTIGGITFYKTQDGFMAREKGSIDAKRIATDPSFQRTRENGSEFGAAGKAAKLLRNALSDHLQNVADRHLSSRLNSQMMKVVHADATNARGKRNVINDGIALLKGFEFNNDSPLAASLKTPYATSMNRPSGKLTVDIPAFIPENQLAAPQGATHFRIISVGAELDFANEVSVIQSNESAALPLDTVTAGTSLTNMVTANSTHPLFLALGIEFLQIVNGVEYALKSNSSNPLTLVDISAS